MRIISGTAPGALRLARLRLQWMDYYEARGRNAALTCRHFDISPQTLRHPFASPSLRSGLWLRAWLKGRLFYRWRHRYDPRNLTTLESRSHRPRHPRQATWSPELAQAVLDLREQYPRWGKACP